MERNEFVEELYRKGLISEKALALIKAEAEKIINVCYNDILILEYDPTSYCQEQDNDCPKLCPRYGDHK